MSTATLIRPHIDIGDSTDHKQTTPPLLRPRLSAPFSPTRLLTLERPMSRPVETNANSSKHPDPCFVAVLFECG